MRTNMRGIIALLLLISSSTPHACPASVSTLPGRGSVGGLGFWVLGFGFWVLGFGFWVLGLGFGRTFSWNDFRHGEAEDEDDDGGNNYMPV